jgi:hypothetical protein
MQSANTGNIYIDKRLDNIPVAILVYQVGWEDYGNFGVGDVNGNPFRTGEYLAFDEYGEDPVTKSLRDHLSGVIEDADLLKATVERVVEWMWQNASDTYPIADFDLPL